MWNLACSYTRVCKFNVSNDEISRNLAIIAHYGEQRLSAVRNCLDKVALNICYWSNYTNNKAKLTRKSEDAVKMLLELR